MCSRVSKKKKSKAEINSITMQMKQQVAQMKMAGCMKTSTEVMKSMQNLRWFLSKHLLKFVFNLGGKQGQNERGGRGQQQTPTSSSISFIK